mgnify:CR=1 FL=1
MFRFLAHHKRRGAGAGFTLIELVVVLAILGILLALAVPQYLGARKRAYKAEIDNILQEVKTLSWAYYQEYGVLPSDMADVNLVMPSGAVWVTPSISAGGGTAAFITWTSSGNGSAVILAADSCSFTLSINGDASYGCSF